METERPGARRSRRPAIRAAGVLLCGFALLGRGAGGAETTPQRALPSRLATQSLLLDAARAGDRVVAVGEWGHVVLSDDGGRSWRQAGLVPTRVTLTGVCFVDPRRGWAVGHDSVILHTRDGGGTWELQHAAPEADAPLLAVWFADLEHGIAVGAFGLMLQTRDGGRTWVRETPGGDGEEDRHLNGIFAGPDGPLFVAAEFGSLYRSLDRGRSWQLLELPYQGSFWGGLSLDRQTVLVFGMRGHAFRSSDRGDTWQAVETATDQSLQAGIRLADGRVVLVGLGGAVLISADGGRTFAASIEPDRRGIAAVAEGADGKLLLFGENGIKTR